MGASWEEIRHRYRELAQRYHPDRQGEAGPGNDHGEHFKDISRAFRILSDYVRKHGLPPHPGQAPQADPGIDTGKVYTAWQESFRHGRQSAPKSAPISTPRRQRIKRVAIIAIPVLLVYLFFGFGSSDDQREYDARWSEDVYIPPAVRTDIPSHIRVGQDEETVRLIQGEPDRKKGDVWYYGESKIFFEDGHVTGWEMDLAHPLRIDLGEGRQGATPRFTYGASKLEVEAIQGQPTMREENVWTYGLSKVYFRNGLVVRWENDPRTPLLIYE